jgi:purine nucleosidase/pyrimidine-specific ribonucleoside hydrolase
MAVRKVIIDTDIGDDVDDALALALALKSPELEVLGVTTVYKNTRLRAGLARRLLDIYGKEQIPVIAGIGLPLSEIVDCTEIPNQYEAVDADRYNNHDVEAVDFIIETVRNARDVTIIAVGPLTNIAAAIMREPDISERAKLVLMGGVVAAPYAENNIKCDPEAARIVFESGLPITMVGLDVTLNCGLDLTYVEMINTSDKGETKFLSKLIDLWQTKFMGMVFKCWGQPFEKVGPTLHDPLAVAYVINPSFLKTRRSEIKIETKGEFTRGVTVDMRNIFNGQHEGYNADVCIDADSDKFIEFFMKRILE